MSGMSMDVGYYKRTARIPPGGYKVVCSACGKKLKMRPDMPKSFCAFVARSHGWTLCKDGKTWKCKEHRGPGRKATP